MMVRILDGIYQLKVPLPGNVWDTNVYLISGEEGWLMVDTGWESGEALTTLQDELARGGIGLSDISSIIITHFHPDHIGLAKVIQDKSKAKVFLHRNEAKYVQGKFDLSGVLERAGRWAGVLEVSKVGSFTPSEFSFPSLPEIDVVLEGGEEISWSGFNLQVIWTPGHSAGHICLYEPEKGLLFSGDHILPATTPNVSLNPLSGDNPLKDYIDSLKLLQKFEVKLALPAHEHIFTEVEKRIEELLCHHEGRKREIMSVLSGDEKTPYEVASRISWLWDGRTISYNDLAPMDKVMALGETLAHLKFLQHEGRVEMIAEDNSCRYKATFATS
jgi:glyoxylase-like metal-dependent hydrolase (beta-lactamase superfamily II)